MHRRSVTIAAAAAIVLTLTSVAAVRGQAPSAAGPPPRPLMAEEVFKNIQVLKGIPVDQFLGVMGIIASSTARGCSECHLQDGPADWTRYAEETPMKQVTRQMLRMTQDINRTHFGGRQVVTCYSCHRGTHRPRLTEPGDVVRRPAG
jgi:photosynthetic reaction center cytochrome c subunit